ncbi:hypothetical protein Hypma_006084 [Hypsizygus marmoreus]|uniref:F-box domain-containing protein n=1 Tax=Hypsizygus marmoreus TaxID=39966 RepID=A0A369JVC7_HYPMA|nr:hypothetical protein Hypma_006084 [Hypsizygus marmoreus]
MHQPQCPTSSCFRSLPGLDSSLDGVFDATAFSARDIIDDAEKQIDARLAALDVSARVLKRQRNAIAPISKLPPETLCNIFQHVRDADREQSPGCINWARVSHVCAHWREIAINFPSLWTYIEHQYHKEWIREMLLRSKGAPIYISANSSRNSEQFLQNISSHIHRVKELSARSFQGYESNYFIQKLTELPPAAAPILEKFSLLLRSDGQSRGLPKDLFPGGTPLLRHLELDNCAVDWNSPIMRNPLTTLKLSVHNVFRGSVKPSVEQVASVLRDMPSLEILELRRILRPIRSAALTSERNVNLIHLKSLSIDSGIYECRHLLDHLILPPTTSITLDCNLPPPAAVQDIQLLTSSLSHWGDHRHRKANPFLTLGCTVTCQDYSASDIVLELWASPWILSKPQLSLRLRSAGAANIFTTIDALLGAIPLNNLKNLRVDFPDLYQAGWFRSFGCLDTLEMIVVEGTEAGVIRALSSTMPSNPRSTTSGKEIEATLAFPALSKLVMMGCNFRDTLVDSSRNDFDRLLAALRQRKKHNQAVNTLVLNSCRFLFEDGVKKLEKNVKYVVWDGYESFTDSEDEGLSTDSEDEESSTEYDSDGNSIQASD